MAAADPGEVFLHDIAALPIFRPESTENDDVPDVEDFDDDASQFTTASINSVSEGDISDHRGALAGAEQNEEVSCKDDENSTNSQNLRPCNASAALSRESVPGIPELPPLPQISRETTPSATTATSTSIPKGRSIAHHDMARKGTMYVSFDIETEGHAHGFGERGAYIAGVGIGVAAVVGGVGYCHRCSDRRIGRGGVWSAGLRGLWSR